MPACSYKRALLKGFTDGMDGERREATDGVGDTGMASQGWPLGGETGEMARCLGYDRRVRLVIWDLGLTLGINLIR